MFDRTLAYWWCRFLRDRNSAAVAGDRNTVTSMQRHLVFNVEWERFWRDVRREYGE